MMAACFLGRARAQQAESAIVRELYRLRNEHKADSAARLFADTVLVYMKYLRNVPREKIAAADQLFWKAHPGNRFEITALSQKRNPNGSVIVTVLGKEYLDGASFKKERIEIQFNQQQKINSLKGYSVR